MFEIYFIFLQLSEKCSMKTDSLIKIVRKMNIYGVVCVRKFEGRLFFREI